MLQSAALRDCRRSPAVAGVSRAICRIMPLEAFPTYQWRPVPLLRENVCLGDARGLKETTCQCAAGLRLSRRDDGHEIFGLIDGQNGLDTPLPASADLINMRTSSNEYASLSRSRRCVGRRRGSRQTLRPWRSSGQRPVDRTAIAARARIRETLRDASASDPCVSERRIFGRPD